MTGRGASTLPLVVAIWLVACGGEPTAPRGAGAACDPERPCDERALVCIDGVCRARTAPPAPAARPLPPLAHPDVVAVDAADATGGDAGDDGDGLVLADAGADADADSDEADAKPVVVITLGPHEALEDPGDTRLGLAPGQAAAREVDVPIASRVLGVEVVLLDPEGLAACGEYTLVLWLPDAAGAFPVAPTWQGEALLLEGEDGAQLVPAAGAPDLPVGPVRFGLRYAGPCPTGVHGPWIGIDASGLGADSFVWANVWIPAASLSLEGRWGLSLVIGVEVR